MNKEIEVIIGDIITRELALETRQVVIGSENFIIPNDEDLHLTISNQNSKLISSNTYFKDDKNTQVSNMLEMIQIDIYSKGSEARKRRAEVVMSLGSIFSKQQQEENNFRINRIPTSFVNSTEAEGGYMLSRFTIVIPCFTWYSKTVELETGKDYYDQFPARVDDESSIGTEEGIIEFNIGG